MKMALCLQGQPRVWKKGYEFLNKEIISKYDVDVFCHTWWSEDMIGQAYDSSPWSPPIYNVEPNLIPEISAAYNFKKFKYEKSKKFIPIRKYKIDGNHDLIYDSLCSRFYSLNQVLTLLKEYEQETNINYDWTIITRPDIGIYNWPDFSLSKYSKEHIYVSNYHYRRKYIYNDNLWVFGMDRKYDFINMFNDFDKNYDMQQNVKNTLYVQQLIDTELFEYYYITAETAMVFHLLFNGVLHKVFKLNELNYNVER